MRIDGERSSARARSCAGSTSSRPSRRCCRRRATPAYARVLEAERWGDEVLQSVPRRLIDAAFLRRPAAMESYAADTKLPLPRPHAAPGAAADGEADGAPEQAPATTSARADLAALPRQLERIDGWIAEGLLGGEQPNAADLQIGSTIRLLMSIGDVRPLIDGAPAPRSSRATSRRWSAKSRRACCPAEWLVRRAQRARRLSAHAVRRDDGTPEDAPAWASNAAQRRTTTLRSSRSGAPCAGLSTISTLSASRPRTAERAWRRRRGPP